jgi:hypothetical protein
MRPLRTASAISGTMRSRTSLLLVGALPLAVVALAGCGGSASHALPTTRDRRAATVGVASTGLGKGHPLYTFPNDTKRGDTNGEGINAFGGSWFAVSPAGGTITPGSQPQGGGGYGGGY